MASGGALPPGFNTVGISEDSAQLLNELDEDIREYFDLPVGIPVTDESVRPNVGHGEDVDFDENDYVGNILTSLVIQSRIRDFVRHSE